MTLNARSVPSTQRWRSRLLRSFFGLNEDYTEIIYEEIFQLKYHGGWSFIEAYNLPVVLRRWFLHRLEKQFFQEKEEIEKASKKSR